MILPLTGMAGPLSGRRNAPPGGGGGFTPDDIAGLHLWLRADVGVEKDDGSGGYTPVTSDSESVKRWLDQSSTSSHATQVTSGPVYRTAALNGRPVVQFAGIGDVLAADVFLTQPCTVVFAGMTSGGNDRHFFDGLSQRLLVGVNSGKLCAYAGGSDILFDTASISTSFQVVSVIFNVATSSLFKAGSMVASGPLSSDSVTTMLVGGGNATDPTLAGSIAELLIYDGILSTGNRETVEDYLGAKYAIAVSH